MYVLYMDILFLINLVMDAIIFIIATMVLNKPLYKLRLVMASVMAAFLYCTLICIPLVQKSSSILYSLFIPVFPILYLYRPMQLKEFVKIFLICNGVAFLIGGTTFSLWYIVGYQGSIQSISFFYIMGIGIVIGVFVYVGFDFIRKRILCPPFEYELEIIHKNQHIKLHSILDTGNMLYTPVTHKAVIVATGSEVEKLFTKEEIELISNYLRTKDLLEILEKVTAKNLLLIPFQSVGCEDGFLVGMEVEKVKIFKQNYEKCLEHCIVGVCFFNLFSDKSYNALLHPDFIIN